MTQVLFVCVKNGGKSQMAAGLLQQRLRDQHTTGIEVGSAGTKAGTSLNGLSVQVLAENGIDISHQHTRQLTPELQQQADWVITLGAEAHVDPLPGPRYETWETDEPSLRGIDGIERMRLVRDDIARHVDDLHTRLTTQDPT
jgi:arsenate-mycothiol transferase